VGGKVAEDNHKGFYERHVTRISGEVYQGAGSCDRWTEGVGCIISTDP